MYHLLQSPCITSYNHHVSLPVVTPSAICILLTIVLVPRVMLLLYWPVLTTTTGFLRHKTGSFPGAGRVLRGIVAGGCSVEAVVGHVSTL